MSYAYPAPPAAPAPATATPARRRPATVSLATLLLIGIGAAGLIYAVVTWAVVPGAIRRFKAAAGATAAGADATQVDSSVATIWVFTVIGAIVALVVFVLYLVLARLLRKGSNVARIILWVCCFLGFAVGFVAFLFALSANGRRTPGTTGAILQQSYPDSWITVNVAVLIAQLVCYPLVGLLLLFGTGEFFSPPPVTPVQPAAYATLPLYGQPPGGYSPPVTPPPVTGGDDEYWSRPSS